MKEREERIRRPSIYSHPKDAIYTSLYNHPALLPVNSQRPNERESGVSSSVLNLVGFHQPVVLPAIWWLIDR